MKTTIKCNACYKENPSKLPDFLLWYCTLWDQRQDTAYSPDSASYLGVSTYLSQWTPKCALIWLTWDDLNWCPIDCLLLPFLPPSKGV